MDVTFINEIKRQIQVAMMTNLGLVNLSSVAVYGSVLVNPTLYGRVWQFECWATVSDTLFNELTVLNTCYYYKINVYLDKKVAQAVEGYGSGTAYTIMLSY